MRALVLHECRSLEMGVEMLKGDLCPDCGARAGDLTEVALCAQVQFAREAQRTRLVKLLEDKDDTIQTLRAELRHARRYLRTFFSDDEAREEGLIEADEVGL